MNAAVRLGTGCAAAVLATAMALGSGAYAQQAEGAAAEAPAEAAPPPANLQSCGAARCLSVDIGPELQQALAAGSATLDQIAEGVVFTYEGEEPLRVYFVAARYNDDRLVRYDVSEAINIEPGVATIPDAAKVIQHALGPRTERGVTAGIISEDVSAPAPELPAGGFVGSMPANTLMAMVRPDLTEPLEVSVRMGLDNVGVLALIPRDAELRAAPEGKSIGAVVRLNYDE